jgi:hypothetical protein
LGCSNEFGDTRIVHDVKANFLECPALSLFLTQDVIMWLVLKAYRFQQLADVFAQELHPILLVGIASQTHPDEMNVIGHQAISRAIQSFTGGGVKHDLAETCVESFVEPSRLAHGHGHGPVDDCIRLIILAGQTGEMESAMSARAEQALMAVI